MSIRFQIIGAASGVVGALLLVALLRSPEAGRTNAPDGLVTDSNQRREPANDTSGPIDRTANQSEVPLLKPLSTSSLWTEDHRTASGAIAISMPQIAEDVQIASPQVAGQIAEAEREMASQPTDPLRSPAMETRIYGEIAQKALGLELTYLQVDCRITLCRIQFALPQSFLAKKFGDVPRDAVWTGREPLSFFIKALDLHWRYTTAFGGLDRNGVPVVLGYVAMPLPSPDP